MDEHMYVAIVCFCIAAIGFYFEIEERFTNWWDRHVREKEKSQSQKNED